MPYRFGLTMFKSGQDRHQDDIAELRAMIEALGATPVEEPPDAGGEMPTGHLDTRLTADDLIWAPEGTPSREVSDAIRRWFPRAVWTDAARVAYYESHWNPTAERNTLDQAGGRCNVPIGTLPDGTRIISEQSVGIFQINVCAHGHNRDYWRDVDTNVAKASGLYSDQGWKPWTWTASHLDLL